MPDVFLFYHEPIRHLHFAPTTYQVDLRLIDSYQLFNYKLL